MSRSATPARRSAAITASIRRLFSDIASAAVRPHDAKGKMARSGVRRLCPSAVRLSSALFGPSGAMAVVGAGRLCRGRSDGNCGRRPARNRSFRIQLS